MAKIKTLKKQVQTISANLIDECLMYKNLHPEFDENKINSAIKKITELSNKLVQRINHKGGAGDQKEIRKNFGNIKAEIPKLYEVVDQLYSAKDN